jgi:ABC-type Mn2+/Zn2+ transport system permease subunit
MKYAVIAIAVVLAVIRPFLAPHPVSMQGSYEALAHVFVGGVFGAWIANRERWLLWTGLGITAVEILSAIASAFRG